MHYCPISDFWILCALQVNRVVFRSFLEMQRRRTENAVAMLRCSSIVTLQRRNVWQRRRTENAVAMLRCSSIVTLQRRNVWSTSVKVKDRPNFATFPRFLHHNYIKHGRPNFWSLLKDVWTRVKNEAGATREIEKTRVFVFIFSKPLMIYRTMLVFNSNML